MKRYLREGNPFHFIDNGKTFSWRFSRPHICPTLKVACNKIPLLKIFNLQIVKIAI